MKNANRMQLIRLLLAELNDMIDEYEKNGNTNILSKNNLKRRITIIREELMKVSKEL